MLLRVVKKKQRQHGEAKAKDDADGNAGCAPGLHGPRNPWLVRLSVFLLLCLCYGLGIFIRMEDYRMLKEIDRLTFYQGHPILTTVDGYYYLRFAKDLIEDVYLDRDPWRNLNRPMPPPLLSIITVGLVRLTGQPLELVAFFLPPFLGVLLFIPVFFWGRHFGGTLTGCLAALFCLVMPFYASRSAIGWLDTDILNITLLMTCAYFFLCFGREKRLRRYGWLAAAGLVWLLTLWWWDAARKEVLVIGATQLGLTILFFYRPAGRIEKQLLVVFILLIGAVLLWYSREVYGWFADFRDFMITRFHFITEGTENWAPQLSIGTSEQMRPDFTYLVISMTNNRFLLGVACIGLIWMSIGKLRSAVLLLPILGIGLLGVFFAVRFLIFLTPALSLGLAYCCARLWWLGAPPPNARRRVIVRLPDRCPAGLCCWSLRAMSVGLTAGLLLAVLWETRSSTLVLPKIHAYRIDGMNRIKQRLPKDAVVWSWWDNGYFIQYFSQRKTIFDGMIHSGWLNVYNAIPLATEDERMAANFIQFVSTHGIKGLQSFLDATCLPPPEAIDVCKNLMSAGPKEAMFLLTRMPLKSVDPWNCKTPHDWLRVLFPPDPPPIYLFLDQHMLDVGYWWFWFGTWDAKRGDGTAPLYLPFYRTWGDKHVIVGEPGLKVKIKPGVMESPMGHLPIGHLYIRRGNEGVDLKYPQQGVRFEFHADYALAVAMDPLVAESIFNKLFVRCDPTLQHFHAVELYPPTFQIWEVIGDKAEKAEASD